MKLTVNIENHKMYESFVQFFKAIGVAVVASSVQQIQQHKQKKQLQGRGTLPITPAKKNADFKALAGIWANRHITIEELRHSVWGSRV